MKSWDYLMRDAPIHLQNLFAVAIRARQQMKMDLQERELSIAEALDVRQRILHPQVEEEAGPNDVLRKV